MELDRHVIDRNITAWSSYFIAPGCAIDYMITPGDDVIRLVFGAGEEINLDLPPESVALLISRLNDARELLAAHT